MKKGSNYKGKSLKLGGGGRFAMVEDEARESDATDPGAVAAAIGRKKYGKAAFQKMAAKGKKKKAPKIGAKGYMASMTHSMS